MQQWIVRSRRYLLAMFLLVIGAAWLTPALGQGQSGCDGGDVRLGPSTESVRDLGACLWYLEDPQQSLSLEDVLAQGEPAFTHHDGGVLNFG